jgi:polyisoprenoid-binding protein YceI
VAAAQVRAPAAIAPGTIAPGTTARDANAPIALVQPDSRFDFTLRTRWGQVLDGTFPQAHGDVVALADGRRQVRLTLPTANVEIVDHPRYTRLTRGPRFFDAERFPDVQFLSEPYTADLLRTGGPLHGRLRMHGVQRRERFVIAPSKCARPGRDCPIVAEGIVQRGNYDLDGWRMALLDEVRFTLHVRLRDVDTGAGAR